VASTGTFASRTSGTSSMFSKMSSTKWAPIAARSTLGDQQKAVPGLQ